MKIIECIGLITSSGVKFTAKVRLECDLTDGKSYYKVGRKKIYSKPEYFVKRQAFETINAKGDKDWWYDNDRNMIVEISKYGKKQQRELQNSLK